MVKGWTNIDKNQKQPPAALWILGGPVSLYREQEAATDLLLPEVGDGPETRCSKHPGVMLAEQPAS